MYRISQLMSTPVARSSKPEREYAGELSSTCVFPSFTCDFLHGDSPFDCCSTDALTGSHFPCRRSPRLLTNGYYVWTEDSFVCDKDGNITLSPSQTSVIYKENLVKIFRKKKRLRRSFSSLFQLGASKSWLHGSILGDVDSSSSEDIWLDEASRLDIHHRSENETSLLGEVSFQTILLAACLIICACARWFLGGILVSVFTGFLVVTIAYVVKSLFLSLASYFEATTCVRFAKFDSHSGAPLMNVFSLDIRKLSDSQSAWNSCFIGRNSSAFTKRLEFDPLLILLFQVNRRILVGQIHQPNPTPGFPQNILNLDLQYVNAVAPCLLKKQLTLEEEGQPAPSLQVAGPFTAGQSMALASQQLLKSVQVSCRVIYCHMGSSVPFSLPAPFQTWSMLRDLH
ncbi:transmembrane protein 71 [Pteropus alecto]|uniref:transmembrane protein 71 n=1 Tax=Pteropus alecto TaxID=9402 RepID=UPI0007685EE3|nr:transmembrane protein 71 [Pteropus alecto]